MPNPIIARVELHEKIDSKPDYGVLKANMARWQFSHQLMVDGKMKLLPTGTYARTEPCPIELARDMVECVADLTGFANCGIVTSDEGLRTFDLKDVLPSIAWLRAAIPAPFPPLSLRTSVLAPIPPSSLRNTMFVSKR
jgi:hypothetical protein